MTNLNYAPKKGKFNSRVAGLTGVVVFHALLIYGLVSGLAQTVVQVIEKKVDVAIISEPPPPPPPPPPPKIEKVVKEPVPQPKEAYVPPPVNPPPVTQAPQNAIAATTADPTPPPPVVPAPPPPPPAAPAGPVSAKANCSQLAAPAYPSKAEEDEVQGVVHVIFSINGAGKFEGIQKISFDHIPSRYQSAFNSSITAALKGYTCKQNAVMEQEFSFRLDS